MIIATCFVCESKDGGGLFAYSENGTLEQILSGGFLGATLQKDRGYLFVVELAGDRGEKRRLVRYNWPDVYFPANLVSVEIPDGSHGLFADQEELYIVDTHGNTLMVMDFNLEHLIRSYNFNTRKTGRDAFHMNDVFVCGDDIYLSMFRNDVSIPTPKKEDDVKYFSSCPIYQPETLNGLGCVTRIKKSHKKGMGEVIIPNLYQPHSPLGAEGWLFVCDSQRYQIVAQKVEDFGSQIKTHLSYQGIGFTRGLAYKDHKLFIGISASVGRPNSPAHHNCGIVEFDLLTGEKKYIPLPSAEVYQVLVA